jgi:uncharacterized protein
MDIMHILGYLAALFTGFVLGLLGGGGALLSIPVLVYLFKIEPTVATGYSLFLIGFSALSGVVQNIRKKHVDYNAALYYGIPSVITVFVVRRFVMPNLPSVIFTAGAYQLDKNHLILAVLCIVMFLAAYKMINANPPAGENVKHKTNHLNLAVYAIIIGAFLGLVGAGGGFLMVPALIYFANLTPKKAIGTSLLLVSVNSFIGFIGDLRSHNSFDWKFLLAFTAVATCGVLLGHQAAGKFDNEKLRKYFGWFIFIVAMIMIAKELFFA